MLSFLKSFARRHLPQPVKDALIQGMITVHAALEYPLNKVIARRAMRLRPVLNADGQVPEGDSHRLFGYNLSLLPNPYLAQQESDAWDADSARGTTGLSIGYPAWNLLYYALMCSLSHGKKELIVVETGTNYGFSTIVMAQALKDQGARARVRTVDIDRSAVERARQNVDLAGLSEYVEFHVQDSLAYLSGLVGQVDCIQFAFLDSNHAYSHVCREFSIIFPKIVACKGKVYLDNTTSGGVARALRFIKRAYGGNFIEFRNCSWSPPGNLIWQPD